MWHGGTNFGRTSGGPFLITSYDYNAPLDEFGFKNEPKYSHLAAFHDSIKPFTDVILNDQTKYISIGKNAEAHFFGDFNDESSVAFFSNIDKKEEIHYTFQGVTYILPKWSVSVVKGGTIPHVIYCTAKVDSIKTSLKYNPIAYANKATFVSEVVGLWNQKTTIQGKRPLVRI